MERYDSNVDGTTGTGPSYTYTSAGRLLTRSWAREVSAGVKVKATYGYTYGLLTSITYNDGTPTVTYNYNAFTSDNNHVPGQLETATQDGAVWTYKYDGTTLRLLSETQPVGGTSVERILTRSYDSVGRPGGFDLGTSADPDIDHTVTYGFGTWGRFSTITGAGKAFTYGYVTNSAQLIEDVVGPASRKTTHAWEPYRDVLASKTNTVGTTTISSYVYSVSDVGQRDSVVTNGTAFSNTDRGWAWAYSNPGQVIRAIHAVDATFKRTYTYDSIGNRTSAADGTGGAAITTTYTPNTLNQYSAINPGTSVNPLYDLDGNLTKDRGVNAMGYGLQFEWDAENHITVVRKGDGTLFATYKYDPSGRRIRKTTTAASALGVTDTAYVYDGWNVIAEYAISSGPAITLTQAYTWGLDLSGTLQGAGGVGGLLCIHRGPGIDGSGQRTWTDNFFPTYDGNGNISEYLDKFSNITAHFEYDPFGRIVATTGTPASFTYRFSTKPQDFETGLLYYGYRYYDPVTGRWPSRDPIEENGGMNLYGFLANDAINDTDILGLAEVQYHHWLMSAEALRIKARAICNQVDLNVDDFTTPYPPSDNKTGTPHHFIHFVAINSYIVAYKGILDIVETLPKDKQCCALLLGVEALKDTIHTLLRKEYENDYDIPMYPQLWTHPRKGTPVRSDAKWMSTICSACSCVPPSELLELQQKVLKNIKVRQNIPHIPYFLARNQKSTYSTGQPIPLPLTPDMYAAVFSMAGTALGTGAFVGIGTGIVAGPIISAPAAAGVPAAAESVVGGGILLWKTCSP